MASFIKHLSLIVLIVLASKALSSQDFTFDTANVILNAKMNIVLFENSDKSRDDIISIIDSRVKYEVIESKGFSPELIFFRLFSKPFNTKDSSNYFYTPIHQFTSSFIFAYNSRNHQIFFLKGFKENDFEHFFNQLSFYLDIHVSSSYDLETKKRFLNAFYIEGVDLDCLYKSLNARNKNGYDCLKPNALVFRGAVW